MATQPLAHGRPERLLGAPEPAADFLADTQVECIAPGRYRGALAPCWAVWGPYGGYVAALALRAALAHSGLPRPASLQCHFLAVGDFAPVDLCVTVLGGSKRAESLRVEMMQADRLLLSASVWMVDDALSGYVHDFAAPPEVPKPAELRGYQELAADEYPRWYPIWRSIEGRPTSWGAPLGAAAWRTWLRFTHTEIRDRADDALRQLFWLDLPSWNSMLAAHAGPHPYFAPNLDLTVQFHGFAPGTHWMLADGEVPLAGDGLLGCAARLWSEDGRLLATGTSKHLCRPNPRYERDLAKARERGLLR
jgi:acyl-CoA thioesterase